MQKRISSFRSLRERSPSRPAVSARARGFFVIAILAASAISCAPPPGAPRGNATIANRANPTVAPQSPTQIAPLSQYPAREISAILGRYTGTAVLYNAETYTEEEASYTIQVSADTWPGNAQANGQQFIRVDLTLGNIRLSAIGNLVKYSFGNTTTYVIDTIPQVNVNLHPTYPVLIHLEIALNADLRFDASSSVARAIYSPNGGASLLEAIPFDSDFTKIQ